MSWSSIYSDKIWSDHEVREIGSQAGKKFTWAYVEEMATKLVLLKVLCEIKCRSCQSLWDFFSAEASYEWDELLSATDMQEAWDCTHG